MGGASNAGMQQRIGALEARIAAALSTRQRGFYLQHGLQVSINQSINYTCPALGLGVSTESMYLCPPSLSILSQPCPDWQDPAGIQILSDMISPASRHIVCIISGSQGSMAA